MSVGYKDPLGKKYNSLYEVSIIAYMLVCSGSVAYLCELTRHIKVVLLVLLPLILTSLCIISRGIDTKEGLVVSIGKFDNFDLWMK